MLTKVKTVIDETLDPSKHASYSPNRSISEILHSAGVTEEDYYEALSVAAGSDFEVHLKRSPSSCFINNFNTVVLRSW